MTDDEKAHEFAVSLNSKQKMGELMALRQGGEIGFLNGLAEGRKELEKENAELKEKLENMQITEYSNLYEQRKILHKNLIDEFTEQLGIMDKEEDVLFSLKAIKSIINFITELE